MIGVGFGPSNLGLAIALEEHNATAAPDDRLTARFVERQDAFGWHRGMLLADTTMQVSYLKDLVTLRNPDSAFTFLSYLKNRDRLVDFINYGSNVPTRLVPLLPGMGRRAVHRPGRLRRRGLAAVLRRRGVRPGTAGRRIRDRRGRRRPVGGAHRPLTAPAGWSPPFPGRPGPRHRRPPAWCSPNSTAAAESRPRNASTELRSTDAPEMDCVTDPVIWAG